MLKGILSSEADCVVIVTGPVGVKEIERPIRKLEFEGKFWQKNPRSPTPTTTEDAESNEPRSQAGAL